MRGSPADRPPLRSSLSPVGDVLEQNEVARDNLAAAAGVCPCCGVGGTTRLVRSDRYGAVVVAFIHEPGCPALTDEETA